MAKKSLIITEQQARGVLERSRFVEVAQNNLNQFLSAIVAGHGHDGQVQVTSVDTDKLLLVIEVPDEEKPKKGRGGEKV